MCKYTKHLDRQDLGRISLVKAISDTVEYLVPRLYRRGHEIQYGAKLGSGVFS